MAHKRFPIEDYKAGQFLAKEPFLSPVNAFRDLQNGRVYRGRLEKRPGYQVFGFLPDPDQKAAGPFYSAQPSDYYRSYPVNPVNGRFNTIDPSTVTFERSQTTTNPVGQTMTANLQGYENVYGGMGANVVTVHATNGTNIGEQIGAYLPNTGGGEFFINWQNHSLYAGEFGTPGVDLSIIYYLGGAGLPVTGIATLEGDGVNTLLAFDTLSCYAWNSVNLQFEVQQGPGSTNQIFFSAEKEDYVWTWPVDVTVPFLVFTNNVDSVYRWTPNESPPVSLMPVDLDPLGPGVPNGGPTAIDHALIAVEFRGRMIYLNVTEDGQSHFRRARWTIAGSVEVFDDDGLGWVDAPASYGNIRTAAFVADRLYVGFANGWMELRRTNDPAQPFQWIPITSRHGAGAKMTTISDGGRLLTRSETSMQAMDPNTQYAIDIDIPDTVTTWATDQAALSVASRNEEEREYWWSYVRSGGSDIDTALVATYDAEGQLSWANYDADFTAFGEYERSTTVVWNQMPGVWDDYTRQTWDDQGVTAGFPLFMGGKLNGLIYQIGQADSDDGEDINFYALTQGLDPFPGMFSHLGWLDIYAESSPGTLVEFTFYDKIGGSAYKNVTVDFSPAEAASKVYRRIRVGRSAPIHQIGIRHNGKNFFAIDSLVPWFRPTAIIENYG